MQILEAEARRCRNDDGSAADVPHHQLPDGDSFSSVNYHLDDQTFQASTVSDVFALPDKSLADQFLYAYLDKVQPSLPILRQDLFMAQYRQVFSKPQHSPGKQWLGVLNLVIAIGSRLKNLRSSDNEIQANERMFFYRAKSLFASDDLIYSHDDLQKVQFLTLMTFYFLTNSQISRYGNLTMENHLIWSHARKKSS